MWQKTGTLSIRPTMRLKFTAVKNSTFIKIIMNKTKIYILAAVALISTVVFHSSCNDKEELLTSEPEFDQNSISSLTTGEEAEELMEFAPPSENPYTIPNMQRALDSLSKVNENECDLTLFDIRITHKYIKFKPQDSAQYGLLIQDTTLELFDYPLDRKLIKAGTYYQDLSLTEGQPNYQWTAVKVDKQLPAGVPFDVLAELYIPEEDPQLVQYYETPFDDCITELIDMAMKITGNFDTTETYEVTDGGLHYKRRRSKWNPRGRIRLEDNVLNSINGLEGAKVRARRWFTTRSMLTDRNGNFSTSHQFRRPANYSIKWERNDYNIRSGRHGQAYFNGPKIKGDWNLDIVSGVSWFYGHAHRGAHTYYYQNNLNIESPPRNGFLGSRIAIGVCDQQGRAHYKHAQRMWFGPEIFMYTSEDDGNGGTVIPNSMRFYETTIHELAHASHFNLSHWHYRNTDRIVKESWAVGVAYYFTRQIYPADVWDWQDLPLDDPSSTRDMVDWGERRYTPFVIDVIDNDNQRVNFSGDTRYPVDRCTEFTLAEVEDQLERRRTLNAWRDGLKSYRRVPDAILDELTANYTAIQ